MSTSTSNSGHNKQLTVNSTVNEVTIYTFFLSGRQIKTLYKKSKQTDRQTNTTTNTKTSQQCTQYKTTKNHIIFRATPDAFRTLPDASREYKRTKNPILFRATPDPFGAAGRFRAPPDAFRTPADASGHLQTI